MTVPRRVWRRRPTARSTSSDNATATTQGSLARRMRTAIAVVVVILLANLATTTWGLLQLRDLTQQIQQTDLPLRVDSGALLTGLVNEETGLRGYQLTRDTAFLQPLRMGQSKYAELWTELHRLSGDDAVVSTLGLVEASVTAWRTSYEVPEENATSSEPAGQVAASESQGKALFDQVRASVNQLTAQIDAATRRDFAAQTAVRARTFWGVLAVSVLGVGLGTILLLSALRAVLRPLVNLRDIARALNDGRPAGSAPPAPPELRDAFNAIVAAASALQERETALARANAELAEASRSKSDFLATMSHELRTPLNAILGFTDLVRSGATGEISANADDYLERVRRNGSILLDLINDVLDLSKIEAGRMVVSTEVVSVESAVREVIANVQSLADAKGIGLEANPSADDDTLALADHRALTQVLTNLVGNAVKFTTEGSVRVASRADHGAILVEVADTGPGIPLDDQAAVFEPFRQVGAHARTGTGGTGLGLAISVRLARLMGGDISLASEPGRGSRFTLRLPAVQAFRSTPSDAGTPVILAVDDDPDALSLWRAQIERMGLRFVGVQQTAAAVTTAATLRPAAILLDVIFPEGSGWDVLEQLRADPRTAAIPVHVISITDGADTAQDRAVSFLQKPVSEEQLRAELARYRRVPVEAAL